MGKGQSLQSRWCGKLDHYLTPYPKHNSKCIKDLNGRPETYKLLGDNIDSFLFDISLSNIFLGMLPQAREIKQR